MFFEVFERRNVNDAEFNTSFKAGLGFAVVVVLNGSKFVFAVDGFVVEDTIQLEGEFERRDVDVEFSIDGVFTVEVEIKCRVELGKLVLKPSFEFGDTSAFSFMCIGVLCSTRLTTEVV